MVGQPATSFQQTQSQRKNNSKACQRCREKYDIHAVAWMQFQYVPVLTILSFVLPWRFVGGRGVMVSFLQRRTPMERTVHPAVRQGTR